MKWGTIQLASVALAAPCSLILIASVAGANDVSPRVSAHPKLYVGKFEPIERAPSGFGPLRALNTDMRRMKADSNAARLSTADFPKRPLISKSAINRSVATTSKNKLND
jgi:hypothetical protein